MIFADGFESGDFSAWSSEFDSEGNLNVTAAAGVGGVGKGRAFSSASRSAYGLLRMSASGHVAVSASKNSSWHTSSESSEA